MIHPGWAAFGLAVLGIIVSVIGSWAVVQFRVGKLEEARKLDREESARQVNLLTTAIGNLDKGIRDSVAAVGKEIKSLLFDAADAGRPFYQRADDCLSRHIECRKDVDKRLNLLENKARIQKTTD